MEALSIDSHEYSYSASQGASELRSILTQGVEDSAYPGAVCAVVRNSRVIFNEAVGRRSYPEATPGAVPAPMSVDTIFDVGTLTASLVTVPLCIRLIAGGRLRISDRVSNHVQGFGILNKSTVTVADLLLHQSGLPPVISNIDELIEEARFSLQTGRGIRSRIVTALSRAELKHEPRTRQLYSDPGMILLGHIVELVTGLPLDKAFFRYLAEPLQLKNSSFVNVEILKRRGLQPCTEVIAPTEECGLRKRLLWGEVQDEIAWAMGGVAGHAGLFSSVGDGIRIVSELIRGWRGQSALFPSAIVREFWSAPAQIKGPEWCMGWEVPTAENAMDQSGFAAGTVGHNALTGCSVWFEPREGSAVLLFTNRIHPNRSNRRIVTLRPRIHKAAMSLAQGA